MSFGIQFSPPTSDEGASGAHRLLTFTTLPRGITLVQYGQSIRQVRFPTEDDLAEADNYWRGGYQYLLGPDAVLALTVAGYGDYMTDVELDGAARDPILYPATDAYPGDIYATGDMFDPTPAPTHFPGFYPGV